MIKSLSLKCDKVVIIELNAFMVNQLGGGEVSELMPKFSNNSHNLSFVYSLLLVRVG